MMKKWKNLRTIGVMVSLLTITLTGCASAAVTSTTDEAAMEDSATVVEDSATEDAQQETEESVTGATQQEEETEIQVFIAASLSSVMEEVAAQYTEQHPNVTITFNADSSGTLLTQIQEGYECDVFFSAAQKQMNVLEEEGMLVEGTRQDVVNNQVCVITYPGSETTVTGLATMENASSIALADGSVPVGRYTRQAMINAGMISYDGEAADLTTMEVSDALGGVEINECGNVSKVRMAIAEQANEVGTVYYSDTYGYEEQIEILEIVGYDLTGNVIYPIAQVANAEADASQAMAAADFVSFVTSDTAMAIFEQYKFDPCVN